MHLHWTMNLLVGFLASIAIHERLAGELLGVDQIFNDITMKISIRIVVETQNAQFRPLELKI